jgi:hypothetical protein
MSRNYKIIRSAGSLIDLEHQVNAAAAEGYTATGGPTRNEDGREWAQAMWKPVDILIQGETRLREPVKGKR